MLRFAPSPTGDLHIGNLRIAIINYIVSVQEKKDFILRIDDTDDARNDSSKIEYIVLLLESFNLKFTRMFSQSENIKFHQLIATDLISKQKAFCCFCDKKELEEKKQQAKKNNTPYRYDNKCLNKPASEVINEEDKPFTVRIRNATSSISFKDKIKGNMCIDEKEVDSFIILKTDKKPTYNFASSVDDMLNNTSFIIRGDDHVSNTPKQLHILKSLDYPNDIKFAHIPIILNENGKKMSKREKTSSVAWLLDEGYLEEAIMNYLLLIGNKTPKEIFSLDEACEFFDFKNLSSSSARFDVSKLKFINREQIKLANPLSLSKKIGFEDENIGKLIKLYTEEASTIKDIKLKIDKILSSKIENAEWKDNIDLIKSVLSSHTFEKDFTDFKNNISKQTNLKGKNLLKPLRYILTGELNGPNLSDLYPLIHNYLLKVVS